MNKTKKNKINVHLTILSLYGTHKLICMNDSSKYDYVISISDPLTHCCSTTQKRLIEIEETAKTKWKTRHFLRHCYLDERDDISSEGPKFIHMMEIISLAIELKEACHKTPPSVLIHCYAGISRSTASAMILLRELGYTLPEIKKYIIEQSPWANPNTKLLQYYDAFVSGDLSNMKIYI